MQQIASIIGVKIKSAKRRFDNCWLCELPIITQFLDKLIPLTFFYSSFFISEKEYNSALKLIKKIFSKIHVTVLGQESIIKIIESM